MRKLIFIVLLFPFVIQSQNCDYQRNEIDKFTKKEILETKLQTIKSGISFNMRVKAESIGATKYVTFQFVTREIEIVKDDGKIMLLDNGGNVHEFISINTYFFDPTVSDYGTFWRGEVRTLYSGELKDLEGLKFTDVRIEGSQGYIERSIPKRNMEIFSKIIPCIL